MRPFSRVFLHLVRLEISLLIEFLRTFVTTERFLLVVQHFVLVQIAVGGEGLPADVARGRLLERELLRPIRLLLFVFLLGLLNDVVFHDVQFVREDVLETIVTAADDDGQRASHLQEAVGHQVQGQLAAGGHGILEADGARPGFGPLFVFRHGVTNFTEFLFVDIFFLAYFATFLSSDLPRKK